MMTTYWDLDEAERAELTSEEVTRYLDAELMLKGVLNAKPPVFEPEPAPIKPQRIFFVIRAKGDYGGREPVLAFETHAEASAFLKLAPLRIEPKWSGGDHVMVATELQDEEIAEAAVLTAAEFSASEASIKRANEIASSNRSKREEYEKARKAMTEATKDVWEDWAHCREQAARLRSIHETFLDYQRIADGDAEIAAKFLRKVYDVEHIDEANARHRFLAAPAGGLTADERSERRAGA